MAAGAGGDPGDRVADPIRICSPSFASVGIPVPPVWVWLGALPRSSISCSVSGAIGLISAF